jgi:hypothetical protein
MRWNALEFALARFLGSPREKLIPGFASTPAGISVRPKHA